MMNDSSDSLLSVKDAAVEVGLAEKNLLTWITKGRLKARRFGRSWVIQRDDLEAFRTWWQGNARAVASKKTTR